MQIAMSPGHNELNWLIDKPANSIWQRLSICIRRSGIEGRELHCMNEGKV